MLSRLSDSVKSRSIDTCKHNYVLSKKKHFLVRMVINVIKLVTQLMQLQCNFSFVSLSAYA